MPPIAYCVGNKIDYNYVMPIFVFVFCRGWIYPTRFHSGFDACLCIPARRQESKPYICHSHENGNLFFINLSGSILYIFNNFFKNPLFFGNFFKLFIKTRRIVFWAIEFYWYFVTFWEEFVLWFKDKMKLRDPLWCFDYLKQSLNFYLLKIVF